MTVSPDICCARQAEAIPLTPGRAAYPRRSLTYRMPSDLYYYSSLSNIK
jgi:hypothetical protein